MNNFDKLKNILTDKTFSVITVFESDKFVPSFKNDTSLIINDKNIVISKNIKVTENNLIEYSVQDLNNIFSVNIHIQLKNKTKAIGLSFKK